MGSVIIQGPLEKRGHFLNTAWKRRLFVLRSSDGTLGYFDDSARGGQLRLKGKIVLRGARLESRAERQFAILTADDVEYPLQADTLDVKERWLAVLAKVVEGCEDQDELLLVWDPPREPERTSPDLQRRAIDVETHSPKSLVRLDPPPESCASLCVSSAKESMCVLL